MANISVSISTGTGTNINMQCVVDDADVFEQVNNIAGIVLAQLPQPVQESPEAEPEKETEPADSNTTAQETGKTTSK